MTDPADTRTDALMSMPGDELAHTLLTSEEEFDLAKRNEVGIYAAHLLATTNVTGVEADELAWLVSDGKDARDILTNSNLRLAMSISRKFRNRGYSEEDVIQDAYHGLVKAVDRYDYTLGYRFSTFATWWVRESVISGLRSAGFIKQPEVLWNNTVKVRAVRMRLTDEMGRPPTITEIAEEASLTERQVLRCNAQETGVVSLQTPIGEDDTTLGEIIDDGESAQPLEAIETGIDRSTLSNLMHSILNDVDMEPAVKVVLLARYGIDGGPAKSLASVATELGISRTTVRQREQAGLRALQDPYVLHLLSHYTHP
jgi:RNA polymerase primary sigma factor